MHGDEPLRDDPKSHKDALARRDADAWVLVAGERKELRNHEVHKTFEQMDRSSMETGTHTRSRLISQLWVYKTKGDGTKKARLVVVGCAQRPGVDFDQTHCSTLKSNFLAVLGGHY